MSSELLTAFLVVLGLSFALNIYAIITAQRVLKRIAKHMEELRSD
jgi:hypothetical protein